LDSSVTKYQKFCYWVDFRGLKAVRRNFEERGVELPDEARIPCRVLRPSTSAVFLSPSAWNGFCKRRTSWLRKSEMSDKFLIVCNSQLDLPDLRHPVIITESNFKPDRLPSPEEISQLIQSKKYQTKKPPEWDKPDPLERDFYQRWFGRQQRKEPFDFDQIFRSHSANHANFIDPKFYVNLDEGEVPYSIADSLYVCSSCLEFFNILGEQWSVKYVVPCIGAVQFAHLPMNKYFKIEVQTEGGL
jgi:hypothetical protein